MGIEVPVEFLRSGLEAGRLALVMFGLAYPHCIDDIVAEIGVSKFHCKPRIYAKSRRVLHRDFWGTVG